MQNLRDKLLKAGLVSAEQATEAAARVEKAPLPRETRQSPPRSGRDRAEAPPRSPARAEEGHGPMIAVRPQPLPVGVPKLPPLSGSREAQRLESRRKLEQDRAVRERVTAAQVPLAPGERTFYFVTRKNRLRRLEMTGEQAAALESGALAVVERPEPDQIDHALVPAATAESLLRDYPRTVRFFNRAGEPVGFLSEDELRTRQTSEADGTAASDEAAAPLEPSSESPSDASP